MLRSSAWLDLSTGPVVISTPDTHGRLYTLSVLDMWTDIFAVLGKRTTGTARGNHAIVPPGWTGALPRGMHRIDAPPRRSRPGCTCRPEARPSTQACTPCRTVSS